MSQGPPPVAVGSRRRYQAAGTFTVGVYNELDWLVETATAATGSSDGAPALGYVTEFDYDAAGNRIETRTPFGDGGSKTRTVTTFGDLGEVLSAAREIAPGGSLLESSFEYDEGLNQVRETDPEGHVTETDFGPRNLPVAIRRAAGTAVQVSESMSYDLEGAVVTRVDPRGKSTTIAYDGFGRVRQSTDPIGGSTRTAYDDGGNVTQSASFDAQETLLAQTTFVYDELDRAKERRQLWWSADAGQGTEVVSTTGFDAVGNIVRTTDARPRASTVEYDAAERRIASTDSAGNRTELTLNAGGQPTETHLIERSTSGGTSSVRMTSTYDALGRQLEHRDDLGNLTAFRYDARSNVVATTDAEGYETTQTFDGLDRVTSTTRPAGIRVEYGYDGDSQRVLYRDALGNTTTWQHDALHRVAEVRYPDQTARSYSYDPNGNPTVLHDPRGRVVTQTFDDANRLVARSVAPAGGETLVGPSSESFAYDGLHRMTSATSGGVSTVLEYDSLSRLTAESTGGRRIAYTLDEVGNPEAIAYPSGHVLVQSFDELDRPVAIGSAVSYRYQGPALVAGRTYGNGIESTNAFDAARRPIETSAVVGDLTVLGERLSWSPRGLKTAQSRTDLNGRGLALANDPAGRLVGAARLAAPTDLAPNNTALEESVLAGAEESYGFAYDVAENLLERTEEIGAIELTTPLPLDGSGRNRPGAVGTDQLEWDANGNLTARGAQTLAYDFRDRLTEVRGPGGELVASYAYDAFNRRVSRSAAGATRETVWSGWRPIEEYVAGALAERRTYGLGIDELVKVESDLTGDGTLETSWVPLYDSTGNLAVATGSDGRVLERYEYSPYGERRIFVDLTPPRIDQVRVVGGEIWLEASEEVLGAALEAALANGDLAATDTATQEDLEIDEVTQPVLDGPLRGRRVVITLASQPAEGAEVELQVAPGALRDSFGNVPVAPLSWTFVWPATDAVIEDAVKPRVERVAVRAGVVEVSFTEEIDTVAAATVIAVPGAALEWEVQADRYTVRADAAVAFGAHTLTINTGALDLGGLGLETAFGIDFVVAAVDQIAWQAPDPREIEESAIGNRFAFHGREVDGETGLMYFRNRYFAPEMGRFASTDPLGYVDGPSVYAFAGNGPTNRRDPLGLYETDIHFYAIYYLARVAGFGAREARAIGFASQYVDDDPYSEPLLNSAKFLGPARNRIRDLHFAAPYSLPVEEGNVYARAAAIAAGRSRNLTRLGIALHTFADTFSHAGFSLDWDSSENRRAGKWFRPNMGHADTDHGGHAPDLPYLAPDKALRMARSVLEVLQDAFQSTYGTGSPVSDSRLDADLMGLFTAATDDKLVRCAGWRGLIWVRFGDSVTYTPSAQPGWEWEIDQQVDTLRSFTTFRVNPYLVVEPVE